MRFALNNVSVGNMYLVQRVRERERSEPLHLWGRAAWSCRSEHGVTVAPARRSFLQTAELRMFLSSEGHILPGHENRDSTRRRLRRRLHLAIIRPREHIAETSRSRHERNGTKKVCRAAFSIAGNFSDV